MTTNNNKEVFKSLIEAKALFEAHPENSTLQEKELSIIAHQLLSLEKEFSPTPTVEEASAIEWAKKYLATM